MNSGIKKRILSLLLCISMILPMVAQPWTVYSVEVGEDATNYGAAIGAVAEWDVTSVFLASNHSESDGDIHNGVSPSELPAKITIVDYAYDEVNAQLWYKVDAAPGYTWPEEYANFHWVYDYAVKIVTANGMTGIYDADGDAVTEITMDVYDKPVLSAASSLQGSVKYQWQIEYEDGKWVDIYGEDEAELTLSIGMIATLLSGDSVNVRCVSTSGSKTATSRAIEVTVDFSSLEEDEEDPVEPTEPEDTTQYTIEVQKDGVVVNELKIANSESSYAVDLSAVTTLTGDVTYTWAMVNSEGTHTLSDLTTAAITLSKMSHINSYLERIDDSSVFTATLRVTATNGKSTVSSDVVIYVYENAVSSYVEVADGEYVDFVIVGDGVADTTLELTKTTSSVVFPEGETALLALDITLRDANGNEWQPAVGEEVTITVYGYQLGLSEGDYFAVYHVHDGKTQLLGPYKVVNGYVTFEVKGFSEFVFSVNYGAAIGGVAEFAGSSVILDSGAVNFGGTTVWVEDANLPAQVVIKNYYFDEYLGKLFYEIDAAPGYTWPADYADLHWCYSDALTNIDVNGTAGVYDENGNPTTEVTVSATESVTVKVETSLQSADIDYKWQICYDTVNDLWVDITGETAAEISLTAGMIVSLMDENNQVKVRCVTTVGSKSVTSDSITVTLYVEDSGSTEEPKAEILLDGESADSVDVNDADKNDFNSVLSVNTNLSGTLTYKWEALYSSSGIWKKIAETETIAPSFSPIADLYIGKYALPVDSTSAVVNLRLTVSDGVTTLTDTFTINVKYETVEAAAYKSSIRASRSAYSSTSDAAAAAEEETTKTYNVIINYLDQNGENVVADPYTSVVSPTTILTNTISFPKIPGYEPHVYQNGNWVRQDTYTFDGKPFTTDFELEVRYLPGSVNYKVNIYIQNAENDEYELFDSFTDTEKTGTVLEEIEFSMDGYYQSKFSSNHAAIAADGSTVFNLYYDRIYYLMKFDLDGGYGVQPIYARHGVKLDIPNPTKAGYTFVGWDQTAGTPKVSNELLNDGIANTMYEYMPIGNTAYKAIWEPVDNAKVTIVYWGENANDEGYSYLESQELYVKPGTELTFGTDQLVCTLTEHTHDSDCTYNCGITPHTHTVEAGCYKLTCTTEYHNHTESGCQLTNCTHVHTLNCYNNGDLNEISKPSATLTNLGDGIYTYTRKDSILGWIDVTCYCLNFNGKWYQADSDRTEISITCTHTHTNVCYSCGKNESAHVHSLDQNCYTLTCQTKAHTHSDDCYSCIAHTHTDDCYLKTNSQDSALWTYVRSDTVTVAADGSTVMNVYYDRTSFTYTFYPANSSSAYGSITDKWGANIYDRWRAICTKANDTNNWTVNTDGSGPWTSYIGVMGTSDMKYYGRNSDYTSTAYYYFEKLDGTYPTDTSDSKNPLAVPAEGSSLSITKEDVVLFEGFTYKEGYNGSGNKINIDFDGDDTYGTYNNAKFYFSRNKYVLEFNNGEGIVKTETVPYQGPLSGYSFTPTAPSKYEAGSVEFAGWYQNPECTGEEVKLDSMTMPATNMLLYAKWVPVKHNVTVYRYRDADGNLHDLLCNHTDEAIGDMEALGSISHGELLNKHYIPEEPTNGNYDFVTWAYYDEELQEEVTIDINSFVVTKDVEIYAKWSSNVQVPYTIKYMIEGTTTEIAAPTEGKHYAGETHTFKAKTAGQLNADYQTGYFPLVTSHSIDFKAEDNSYEYIFYYVQKPSVPYTVYYVTETPKEGDTLQTVTITENGVDKTYYMVADTKSTTTTSAIVTENFVKVSGYMPDAYQKTLIIDGSDDAVNQIVFVYSVNTTQAYYKVTHWTQQLDGSWFAHSSYENVGTIGDTINESPTTITGFTYRNTTYKVGDNEPTEVNAPLTADGLEINLYYTRNLYPYTVQYVLQGTTTVLHTETIQDQMYGATVSHTAPLYWETGDVYERVSAETLSTTIQTDASKNLITFYYIEREVTIKYEVANGIGGIVNPTQETVLIKSEDAEGSTAAASAGYQFLGWYDPQNNKVGDELEFVPDKVNGLNVAATYYAKFEEVEVTINYVVDGPDGCGTVTPGSETLGAVTGTAQGSTAAASAGYKFLGWYDAQNNKVGDELAFVPDKVNGLNVAATYYAKFEEVEVTIYYEVMGPAGCGTLTTTEETLLIKTGVAAGSVAAPTSNAYKFVGWYDAQGNWLSSDFKYTPTKADDALWVNGTTYYAKFEYNLTSLTIVKDGAEAYEDIDPNQTFVFDIYDGTTLITTVTVNSASNWKVVVDGLTVGKTYTVIEKTEWSWRYNCTAWAYTVDDAAVDSGTANEAEITLGLNGTITFTNNRSNEQWLDGDSWCNNIFDEKGE